MYWRHSDVFFVTLLSHFDIILDHELALISFGLFKIFLVSSLTAGSLDFLGLFMRAFRVLEGLTLDGVHLWLLSEIIAVITFLRFGVVDKRSSFLPFD